MTLCINPNCAQPNHADNGVHSHCQSCGADLIIQGRYRVMRLLKDNSGFGLVYEAFERDQPKILKLLKPTHNQQPKAIQLFKQEARVLSRLQHPGVPHVEADGCFQLVLREGAEPLHCIVMEKIDGPNLSEWMHQQGNYPISEHQALRWLQQLAEVLHLIHQQQYFHRDIKPDNIMLRSTGQIVLVDFGAVREVSYTYFEQLESVNGITRISSVGYTAPEQERGKAVPQSDFYALGCTFIYLLTGKRPLDVDIYDPTTNEFCWRPLAPHLSNECANFIDQLTASRVVDRPRNTLEILAKVGELQELLQQRQPELSDRQAHRSPGSLMNDGTVAEQPSESAEGTPQPFSSATLPPDHTFIGAISPQSPSQSAASRSVPLQSVPLQSVPLQSAPSSSGDSSAQDAAPDTTVSAVDAGIGGTSPFHRQSNSQSNNQPSPVDQQQSVTSNIGSTQSAAVSEENSADASTSVQDATTQLQAEQAKRLVRGSTIAAHSRGLIAILLAVGAAAGLWGGRSLYLASKSPDRIQLPALSVQSNRQLDGHSAAVNALAISLDQRFLASASDDKTVRLWDLVAGQEIMQLVGHGDRVQAVAISPNGQLIASGGGDNLIKLWKPLTGEAIATLKGHRGPINALAITVDGQRLVSASADKTIKVWDLTTSEQLASLTGHKSFVNALAISPDGSTLASGSADRTIKLWHLGTYDEIATLAGHESFINTLLFSLNGDLLISGGADHLIKLWDSVTYESIDTLDQHTSFINALAMTLDGRYLVSTSADQTMNIWDLKTKTVLSSIAWPNTFINTVAIRVTGSTWQILAGGRGSDAIRIWNLDSAAPSSVDQ